MGFLGLIYTLLLFTYIVIRYTCKYFILLLSEKGQLLNDGRKLKKGQLLSEGRKLKILVLSKLTIIL